MTLKKLGKALCILIIFITPELGADQNKLEFSGEGDYSLPLLEDRDVYDSGYRLFASMDYLRFSLFNPFIRAGTATITPRMLDEISIMEGMLGLGSRIDFGERFFGRVDLAGGLYQAQWGDFTAGGFSARTGLELGIRLNPAFRLSAIFNLSRYFSRDDALYTAFGAGIKLNISPSDFDVDKIGVHINTIDFTSLFPVFYTFYDDHPFGTIELLNKEEAPIRDLQVSFYAPEYMSGPSVCGVMDVMKRGEKQIIPITALFNERILTLTEQSKTRGELIINYRILGSKREFRQTVDLSVHHRNAMTWDDDRKASAFVSPNDPAVLWFSRYVTASTRNNFRAGIDRNIQTAVSIFEALKLFGLTYVIDPASAYVAAVGNENVVDYLQYPHQTLFFRGGDCDDISILYASLLQSLGIQTAFITIPGHIYMAFVTQFTEKQAHDYFFNPDLLIYIDGKAWVPVEITMVKDGFVRAWRVGAESWVNNSKTGTAEFFPMNQNWQDYPPVSISGVDPHFKLPEEPELVAAFDVAMDRYVSLEIVPQIENYRVLAASIPSEEYAVGLGQIFARSGMNSEAEKQFRSAAEAGYTPAWTNLANLAFVQGKYDEALEYYDKAAEGGETNSSVVLGKARTEYELENFTAARDGYNTLLSMDKELADRYSYLVSIFGGSGRAWSYAERAETVEWSLPPSIVAALNPTAVPEIVPVVPEKAEEPVVASVPEKAPEVASAEPVKTEQPIVATVPELAPVVPELAPSVPEKVEEPVVVAAVPETTPIEPEKAVEPVVVSVPEKAPELAPAEPPVKTEPPIAVVIPELIPVVPEKVEEPVVVAAMPETTPIEPEKVEEPVVASIPEKAPELAPAEPEKAPEVAQTEPVKTEPPIVAVVPELIPVVPEKVEEFVVTAATEITPAEPEKAAEPAVAAITEIVPPKLPPITFYKPPSVKIEAVPETTPVVEPVKEPTIPEKVPAPKVTKEPEKAPVIPKTLTDQKIPPPIILYKAPTKKPEETAETTPLVEPVQKPVEPEKIAEPTEVPAPKVAKEPEKAPVIPKTVTEQTLPPPIVLYKPPSVEPEAAPETTLMEEPAEPEKVIESKVAAEPEIAEESVVAAITEVVPVVPPPETSYVPPSTVPDETPLEVPVAEPVIAAEVETVIVAEPEKVVEPELVLVPEKIEEPAEKIAEPPVAQPVLEETKQLLLLAQGFTNFTKSSGSWDISDTKALQMDAKQYFAKIAYTHGVDQGVLSLRFTGRSTEAEWSGFGVHIAADKVEALNGYGAGTSILVWFTSDKKHQQDIPERIQIYRSFNDIDMRILSDTPYSGSFKESHDYQIDFDSESKVLTINIDGVLMVTEEISPSIPLGPILLFRALNKAEFSNFSVEIFRPEKGSL